MLDICCSCIRVNLALFWSKKTGECWICSSGKWGFTLFKTVMWLYLLGWCKPFSSNTELTHFYGVLCTAVSKVAQLIGRCFLCARRLVVLQVSGSSHNHSLSALFKNVLSLVSKIFLHYFSRLITLTVLWSLKPRNGYICIYYFDWISVNMFMWQMRGKKSVVPCYFLLCRKRG